MRRTAGGVGAGAGAIVGAVAVAALVSACGGAADDTATSSSTELSARPPSSTKVPPVAKADVGLNTAARDGNFEFVVTGVQTTVDQAGDNAFIDTRPKGQYAIVAMTVTNVGTTAQPFSPFAQRLVDTRGSEYENNTRAQIAIGGADVAAWNSVAPGTTLSARIVYDIPLDAVPASIELHDSMMSAGVTVSLRP